MTNVDLTQTIAPKVDQLTADDLIGRTLTIKITGIKRFGDEQPIAISFDGDEGRPWKPCKSMRRVLVHCWGGDGNAYVGRSLTLYRDGSVKFGGLEVGGIRISHMSDIHREVTVALTASKANKKPFTVKPLSASQAPAMDVAAWEAEAMARIDSDDDAPALTAWWNSADMLAKRKAAHAVDSVAAGRVRAAFDARVSDLMGGV